MPYYDKSSDDAMKDEEVDFKDVMNIMSMLDDFAEALSEEANVEKAPKVEGRTISLVLTPKKN